MKKHIKPDKYLWVDLEMTGLDPAKSKIIEVAAIVTDVDLNELATYEAIVHQPDSVLNSADVWVKENMDKLLSESRMAKKSDKDVEAELVEFIKEHFEDRVVLAGNSIHQDRRFIRQWWHDFEGLLHYRMLDVSAWKVYMVSRFDLEFNKANEHRALDDIRGSILELKYYLDFFGK